MSFGNDLPPYSQGKCWAGPNTPLSEEYIPCGATIRGGSYTCCLAGDKCVTNNACYNENHGGFLYIVGCTDEQFKDTACQNKGRFSDQPWVGIFRCDPKSPWFAGCTESDDLVGSSPPYANCSCEKKDRLFKNSTELYATGLLPTATGLDIVSLDPIWGLSTAAVTTVAGATATTTAAVYAPTQTGTVSPPPSFDLAGDAKAGIIGFSVGFALLILGVLVYTGIKKRWGGDDEESVHVDQSMSTDDRRNSALPAEHEIQRSSLDGDPGVPFSPDTFLSPTWRADQRPSSYIPYRPGAVFVPDSHTLESSNSSPAELEGSEVPIRRPDPCVLGSGHSSMPETPRVSEEFHDALETCNTETRS